MGKGLPRSLSRGVPQARPVIKERISVENVTVTVTATGAAIGFGSAVLGDFPEGNILLLGAVALLSFAGSGSDANLSDTWSGDYGVGSAPIADADLGDTADVDIIPSTALDTASAEAHGLTRGANATQVMLDNTDGSLEINLNVLIDAADIDDDESVDITVNGSLDILYSVLGDD